MNRHSKSAYASIPAALMAGLLVLSGCSAGEPSEASGSGKVNSDAVPPAPPSDVASFGPIEPGSGEGLTVGFTQLTLAAPFPTALQSGMEEAAKSAGIDLITCDSKFDTATALDCARQFKDRKSVV